MDLANILDAFLGNLSNLNGIQTSTAFAFSLIALFVAWAAIESLASKYYQFKTIKTFAQERERSTELLVQATSVRLHDILQATRFTQEQIIELRKDSEKLTQLIQEIELKSTQRVH